eukprot:scpid106057/ scgid20693/ 
MLLLFPVLESANSYQLCVAIMRISTELCEKSSVIGSSVILVHWLILVQCVWYLHVPDHGLSVTHPAPWTISLLLVSWFVIVYTASHYEDCLLCLPSLCNSLCTLQFCIFYLH